MCVLALNLGESIKGRPIFVVSFVRLAIQNLAPRLIRDLWRDTFYWWEDCKEARQRREEIRTKLIVNYERENRHDRHQQ